MPGEFEPHDETWVIWPERTDVWRLGAKPAQPEFAQVIEAVAGSEHVSAVASRDQWDHARTVLPPEVRVIEMTTNDAWIRDSGPTFVVDDDGHRRAVDWRFTAGGGLEGGLYFPWDQDDLVARKVLDIEGTDRYRAPVVLKGGSIHVGGEASSLRPKSASSTRTATRRSSGPRSEHDPDRLRTARRADRRRSGGDPAAPLSRARGDRRTSARDSPRGPEHPLHHPAGPATEVTRCRVASVRWPPSSPTHPPST